MISPYKDPHEIISIMECHRFFLMAHFASKNDLIPCHRDVERFDGSIMKNPSNERMSQFRFRIVVHFFGWWMNTMSIVS